MHESSEPQKQENQVQKKNTASSDKSINDENQQITDNEDHVENKKEKIIRALGYIKKIRIKRPYALEGKLKNYFSFFRGNVYQIFLGLFSKDKFARRMSALFFLSVFGLLWVFSSVFHALFIGDGYFSNEKQLGTQAQNMARLIEKQNVAAYYRSATLRLGKFSVPLKLEEQNTKTHQRTYIAELVIDVECDEKKTCQYIEKNISKVRDQVLETISGITKKQAMSKRGKDRLREKLTMVLNHFLKSGEIKNVFFSHFIMG